jgi:hypothetical protein
MDSAFFGKNGVKINQHLILITKISPILVWFPFQVRACLIEILDILFFDEVKFLFLEL